MDINKTLPIPQMDISTKKARRFAANVLATQIELLLYAEEAYQKRIPHNLQNSFHHRESELTQDYLMYAHDYLTDAF